jgi:hypothetical protein
MRKAGMSALAAWCALAWAGPVLAEPSPQAALLNQEIAAKVPRNWQIHVTWRDKVLLAFITPPYQEAFDLWYEPTKLHETMLNLCPKSGDPIWRQLGPGEEVAMQPTVGGKSDDSMKVPCPRVGA